MCWCFIHYCVFAIRHASISCVQFQQCACCWVCLFADVKSVSWCVLFITSASAILRQGLKYVQALSLSFSRTACCKQDDFATRSALPDVPWHRDEVWVLVGYCCRLCGAPSIGSSRRLEGAVTFTTPAAACLSQRHKAEELYLQLATYLTN